MHSKYITLNLWVCFNPFLFFSQLFIRMYLVSYISENDILRNELVNAAGMGHQVDSSSLANQ